MTRPFCPAVGPLIDPSLWKAAEPRSTAHTRHNGPSGAGAAPASESRSQAGPRQGVAAQTARELLDPKPPKPPRERSGRASGPLPATYDLSVIPKCPLCPATCMDWRRLYGITCGFPEKPFGAAGEPLTGPRPCQVLRCVLHGEGPNDGNSGGRRSAARPPGHGSKAWLLPVLLERSVLIPSVQPSLCRQSLKEHLRIQRDRVEPLDTPGRRLVHCG